jgi:APA family basic amino acid/polyamine antiporter
MLAFTVAHMSVIRLRYTDPDRERPYRVPGSIRFRGGDLPLISVFGGLGTGLAFIVVSLLNLETLIAGTIWVSMGALTYYAYRRRLGLSLTQTKKIVTPEPIVDREVEYESVLVAFEDRQYSREVVSTAVKLAARRRRGVHVLVTITVPNNIPIGAALAEEESLAQETIDSARVVGGRRVTGHWEKVRPGEAGRRIVDEAIAIRARAIVMIPARRTGSSLLGRTLEYVLSHRPCRVIVDSEPGPSGHPVERVTTAA